MSDHSQSPNRRPAEPSNIAVPSRRWSSDSSPRSHALRSSLECEMTTGRKQNAGPMEDFLIVSGLIAVQIVGALYTVLLKPILSLGIKPLFLIFFGSLAMAFFVFPFAIALEKNKWPSKLSLALIVQFVLISLGTVTIFQALMFVGIKKTSPAIASAMPNLAPGIIFIIAACFRFEKVDFKCNYTRAKVVGTMVCLAGAVSLSFLQSPMEPTDSQGSSEHVHEDWIIGCSCLLGAVLVLSCSTVLQAATMMEFPAPLSLCFITSILGSVLTATLQFFTEGKLDFGQPNVSIQSIVSFVFLGGMMIALCVAFQTWAVMRKGPVMVSMFSPIQTLSSAVLSATMLGQVIQFESLIGMLAMFTGLYMVLWAKKKERFAVTAADDNDNNLIESANGDTVRCNLQSPLLPT